MKLSAFLVVALLGLVACNQAPPVELASPPEAAAPSEAPSQPEVPAAAEQPPDCPGLKARLAEAVREAGACETDADCTRLGVGICGEPGIHCYDAMVSRHRPHDAVLAASEALRASDCPLRSCRCKVRSLACKGGLCSVGGPG